MIDSPDTKKLVNSIVARTKAIELSIERALEKGSKPIFHESLGLDLTLDKARKKYAEILVEEGEEAKGLPVLSEFIDELTSRVQASVQAMNPPPAEGGGGKTPPLQNIANMQGM